MLSHTDINGANNDFLSDFTVLYNHYCPLRRVNNSNKSEQNNPWLKNDLKNACWKKNKLYKRFLSNRNNDTELRYKSYKNKLTTVIRFVKQDYYSKLLSEHWGNLSRLGKFFGKSWGYLDLSAIILHNLITMVLLLVMANMANTFNKYFTSIGLELAKHIETPPGNS